MGIIDERVGRVLFGVGVGVAAASAAPIVAPIVRATAAPVARALLKHGMLAFERSREQVLLAAEGLEDIIAEVRTEVDEDLKRMREAEAGVAEAEERGG